MAKTSKIIFTEEDLNKMIQLHNDGYLNYEIADIFGVSKSTINRRLQDLNIPSKHPRLDQEREKKICKLYLESHNVNTVCKIVNADWKTVSKVLKKHNIYQLSSSEVHRKYHINEMYFEKIDTCNKAYFLGLLFSDGTITKKEKHVFSISLQERDKDILEKMLADMNADNKLYFIPYSTKNNKWQNQYYISINNQKLCDSLNHHGMYPNKSLSVEYPVGIPSIYDKDFIRGLMDGDGHISKTGHHISITGTEMILKRIQNIIYDNLKLKSSISSYSRNPNSVTKDFKIYGRKQAYIFLSWIYDNSEMHIDRKYNLYVSEYKNKVA